MKLAKFDRSSIMAFADATFALDFTLSKRELPCVLQKLLHSARGRKVLRKRVLQLRSHAQNEVSALSLSVEMKRKSGVNPAGYDD